MVRRPLITGAGLVLAAALLPSIAPATPPAAASGGEPALVSGVVVGADGRPLPDATVTVRVEQDQPDRHRTLLHPLATGTSGADGRFDLAGELDTPATVADDGSVRLEITAHTDGVVRYYYLVAVPPTATTSSWTWAPAGVDPGMVDLGVHGRAAAPEDLAGAPVEHLVLRLAADTGPVLGRSRDVAGSPHELVARRRGHRQQPAARPATGGSRLARAEAEVARGEERCAMGENDVWWRDKKKTRRRMHVVGFLAVRNKARGRFSFADSDSSTFSIAMTGAGADYEAGLAHTRGDRAGAGFTAVKSRRATRRGVQNWKIQVLYRKQAKWCFNGGYPYKLGRTRWVPRYWTGGNTVAGDATRFDCDPRYRVRSEGNLWVTRASVARWTAWVSIGGVELSSQQHRTRRHRQVYVLKDPDGFMLVCGRGAHPTRASFAEEVRS